MVSKPDTVAAYLATLDPERRKEFAELLLRAPARAPLKEAASEAPVS